MMKKYITKPELNRLFQSFTTALDGNNINLAELIKDRFLLWISDFQNGTIDLADYEQLTDAAEIMLDKIEAYENKEVDSCAGCPGPDEVVCNKDQACCADSATTHEAYTVSEPTSLPDCVSCPEAAAGDCDGVDPENCGLTADDTRLPDYFDQVRGHKLPGAGDVSRDDQNRHQREARLGFKAPSEDWKESHRVIRCIWPNQTITRPIDKDNEYFHFMPAIGCLKIYFGTID